MKEKFWISIVVVLFVSHVMKAQVATKINTVSPKKENKMLEIRAYNLKPGTRNEFDRLTKEKSMPLLSKWKMEVVAYGPSVLDENSYFLIRAFKDMTDLQKQEDAFYGSDDWRQGPREEILALIVNYTSVVMPDGARAAVLSKLENTMGTESDRSDKELLSELNAKFIRNFVNSDTVQHNEIIHPDFIYISSSGKIIEREQYMRNWAHGFDKAHDKIDYTNEIIRIFGNAALVRCNTTYTEIQNGKLIHGKTVYTDTYVKERGRWWCVQAQITEDK